ncbi:alpha-amylase [Petrimonas sulfuriphila]|uniref:alpha-amylase n=1 Tax=Petrimonas sulfuriphila TaxID=285070 RepID=UPI003EB7BA2B
MNTNGIIFQYFEWFLSDDGSLWKKLKSDAEKLKEVGITAVWIPPCTKGTSSNDVGYGAYDLYDLGEFDQKGTIRTKYGTKEELHQAIEAMHEHGINVYADVVFNHKGGGDELQTFTVVEVNPDDRNEVITEPFEIESYTSFTFPGRNGKYSDFKWSWEHFSATDYNYRDPKEGIYVIQGENKGVNPDDKSVGQQFGNFDFLLYNDIDFKHRDVREELKRWISWFIKETKVDGLRLDAIKHISDWYIKEFIEHVRAEFGESFFIAGEYSYYENMDMNPFLMNVEHRLDLFDVVLHYHFRVCSLDGAGYDMSTILTDTIVEKYPERAVTYVNNHDSHLQDDDLYVLDWFKPIAYALILLRKDGYPCIFFGDYYGIEGPNPKEGQQWIIDQLLDVRRDFAYGDQEDYFDHKSIAAWIRRGDENHPDGCVVIMSNDEAGDKRIFVGTDYSGSAWFDKLGHIEGEVTVGQDGYANFPVRERSVSVYLKRV